MLSTVIGGGIKPVFWRFILGNSGITLSLLKREKFHFVSFEISRTFSRMFISAIPIPLSAYCQGQVIKKLSFSLTNEFLQQNCSNLLFYTYLFYDCGSMLNKHLTIIWIMHINALQLSKALDPIQLVACELYAMEPGPRANASNRALLAHSNQPSELALTSYSNGTNSLPIEITLFLRIYPN